ncbi:MAG: hypothetical protein HYV35_02780 [Lentisphaerae bacterium]|nr:hypothetical protein [Lentisphaerota bacterium]
MSSPSWKALGFAAIIAGLLGSTGWTQGTNLPPPPPQGTNFTIVAPPDGSMTQVSSTNAGAMDDNLIWSHSGDYLAVDRSGQSNQKLIYIINLEDLSNVQGEGARSSDTGTPVLPNITDWTANDDRVLFGNTNTASGKARIASCTAFGATNVATFLADTSGVPLHVYSPSVISDTNSALERLLFLTSTAIGDPTMDSNPMTRINVWTVTYGPGGVPNWNNRVPLTAITITNSQIESVKWCPELDENYDPIMDRYALVMKTQISTNPPQNAKKLVTFSGVRDILNGITMAPSNLLDVRFSTRETNASMGSQVSWTQNGLYLMYSKDVVVTNFQGPPPPSASELYSVRSTGATTPEYFPTPTNFLGANKQWLNISPDGMRAAFTINKNVYVLPMQFDNMALAGTSNLLSDGGYTLVNIPAGALSSNHTFSIMSPNTVNTNDTNVTIIDDTPRTFVVDGNTNQTFQFNTNVDLTLVYSTNDLPAGLAETNLSLLVFDPTNVANGRTGTWSEVASTPDTTNDLVSGGISHFSIYAIGYIGPTPVAVAPVAPTYVIASDGTFTGKVLVVWGAVTNAAGYSVWRSGTNDANSATLLSAGIATNNYDDTNALDDVTYYYWVKATNSSGTSTFSSSDTGWSAAPLGPAIRANGQNVDSLTVSASDTVAITVSMNPDIYLGVEVDWWLVASANFTTWFYMEDADDNYEWTQFSGALSELDPVYMGALFELPATTVLPAMNLPPGSYDFWFAVDYPMNDALNTDAMLIDHVQVIVQ